MRQNLLMLVRVFILPLAISGSLLQAEEWSPPDNPNPTTILDEARADVAARRFDVALAKHVWYHEHALSIQPSQYGVRLSFALADWLKLADQYPPAMTKLKDTRDAAREKVIAGGNVRNWFHDMASINKYLNEESVTKDVFEALDEKHPEQAKSVYSLAQPSLVKGKAYALMNKYVVPQDDYAKMKDLYLLGKKSVGNAPFAESRLKYYDDKFANDSATLVAILVVNDRKDEATKIAAAARGELDKQSFRDSLGKALKGTFPEPWP